MGLFDLFKSKQEEPASKNPVYALIHTYREYLVLFMGMQQKGNYAPVAAYEKPNGELTGYLYINADPGYSLSAEEVIERMKKEFEDRIKSGSVRSAVILYHSRFQNNGDHAVANTEEELKAISVVYNSAQNIKGIIALPYRFESDSVNYTGFTEFTPEQNKTLFAARPVQGKEYFQDRVKIESPLVQNEAGIPIRKSNQEDLANTWAGIFGFGSYRKEGGERPVQEHFALTFMNAPHTSQNGTDVHELDYGDVILRSVKHKGRAMTMIPVIKTDYFVDVENKSINEWENVDDLEAVITARGRDTFGVTYFATDYARNREKYRTQKKLNIELSGILYVLALRENKEDSELKYSDDFAGYFPNKDLERHGCFDFMGVLEDFRETALLENKSLKGYILNVRLINHPDRKDFFTIDMYVQPENMRFATPEKGMKISGMFQLQGQIKE